MDRDLTFHSLGGETDFWSFCIHGLYIYIWFRISK